VPRANYKRACQQAFERLCKMAARGQTNPFIVGDLVYQEDLYEAQNDLSDVLLTLAQELGPAHEATLVKRFPYVFSQESAPGG
jgi:hypothetical protein